MPRAKDLEAPCQTFCETVLNQKRRGTKEQHSQVQLVGRILIPQSFCQFRPARHFLNLVQDQQPRSGLAAAQACRLPLLLQPNPITRRRVVGRCIRGTRSELFHRLPCQGRFAHLPRTRKNLQEPAWFLDATEKRSQNRTRVHRYSGRLAFYLNMLSKITT